MACDERPADRSRPSTQAAEDRGPIPDAPTTRASLRCQRAKPSLVRNFCHRPVP